GIAEAVIRSSAVDDTSLDSKATRTERREVHVVPRGLSEHHVSVAIEDDQVGTAVTVDVSGPRDPAAQRLEGDGRKDTEALRAERVHVNRLRARLPEHDEGNAIAVANISGGAGVRPSHDHIVERSPFMSPTPATEIPRFNRLEN